MKSELELDLLDVLVKHNVIPEHFVRDHKIRIEYENIRKTGKHGKQALGLLAEKYETSEKNIEFIIYHKKNF